MSELTPEENTIYVEEKARLEIHKKLSKRNTRK